MTEDERIKLVILEQMLSEIDAERAAGARDESLAPAAKAPTRSDGQQPSPLSPPTVTKAPRHRRSFRAMYLKRAAAKSAPCGRCANYELPDEIIEMSPSSSTIEQSAEVRTIQTVVTAISGADPELDGYEVHRTRWLTSNIRLNVEGRLAPRFRPRLQATWKPVTQDQLLYALDRQIVDLHWLHCTGVRRSVDEPTVSTVLQRDSFDWDMAMTFAESDVRHEVKVGQWLGLSELERWQLAALQDDATRKRHTAIFNGDRSTAGVAKVRGALAGMCRQSNEEIEIDLMLWRVAKMLPTASATPRSILFARGMGYPTPPAPHIYARKESAALKRIQEALSK